MGNAFEEFESAFEKPAKEATPQSTEKTGYLTSKEVLHEGITIKDMMVSMFNSAYVVSQAINDKEGKRIINAGEVILLTLASALLTRDNLDEILTDEQKASKFYAFMQDKDIQAYLNELLDRVTASKSNPDDVVDFTKLKDLSAAVRIDAVPEGETE